MMTRIKASMIDKCQELIKSFNPVTHSIDTHVNENLGNTKAKVRQYTACMAYCNCNLIFIHHDA